MVKRSADCYISNLLQYGIVYDSVFYNDFTSRVVQTIFKGKKTAGNNEVVYTPQSIFAGSYFISLSCYGICKTLKCEVVR